MGTLNFDRYHAAMGDASYKDVTSVHGKPLSETDATFYCTQRKLPFAPVLGHERLIRLLVDSQLDRPRLRFLEQEEIFGPVLAVIKSKNFDHGLEIANDTEFGLTGAVYTTSKEKIERAKREFHVGNLYINRKCTGATVGAHPFGGFNMSGTDSKSGGPDYLYLFTQGKSVGEKVR